MKKILSIILAVILVFSVMTPVTVFAENGPYPFDPENEDIVLSEFSALGLIDGETYDIAVLYPETEVFDNPDVFKGATYNLETNTLTLNNVKCKTAMLSATEMGDDFKIELIGYNELGGIISTAETRGGSITVSGNGELVLNRTGDFGGIMIEAGETASKLNISETVKMKLYYGESFETPAIYIHASTVTDPSELIVIGGDIRGEAPAVNNYTRDIYEQLDAYESTTNSLNYYDFGFIKDGIYYIGVEAYDEETYEFNGKYYLYSLDYDEDFGFYVATDYANGEAVSADGFTKLVEYDVLFDEANGFNIGYTFFAEEGDDSYKSVFYPYGKDTFDLCIDESGTKYAFEQYPYEEEDENGVIESGVDTYVYNLIEHPVFGWIAILDWNKETLDGLTPLKIGEKDLADATLNSTLVINNGGSVVEPSVIKGIELKNTNEGVKISWKANSTAEQYKVYRKTASDKKWTLLYTLGADKTSYIDKTAKSGKKYIYTVRGGNFVGWGSYNEDGVSITHTDTPQATAKNTSKGIYLKWTKIAGAEKYKIYRQTEGSTKWKLLDTTEKTKFTDKTAKSGTKYYYRVRAVAGGDMSSYEVVGRYYLSTPKLSSATNASTGVKVKWEKVTGAEGYKVYRKTGSGSYEYIGKTSKTTYTDKTAKSGKTYTYTVKAYYSKTNGTYNETGLKLKYLAAPKTKATIYTSSISVSWSKVSGAKEYIVYRKASGDSKFKKVATTTKTSYKDTNVKNNKTYSYRVKAINGKTISSYKTVKCSFLKTPSIKSITNTGYGQKITWDKVSGADGYKIYVKMEDESSWTLLKTVKGVSKTSYKNDNLRYGFIYQYTVRAYNDSVTSALDKTGDELRYIAPVPFYLKSNKKGVEIGWGNMARIDQYKVYRKADGESKWTLIATITSDDEYAPHFDYTDTNVKKGKKYSYKVVALDQDENNIGGYKTQTIKYK